MNEETIKELLSINYIRVIAEREGFIVTKVEQDYGDDLVIKQVKKMVSNRGFKYFSTGGMIEIQLKCTTEKSIKRLNDNLQFRIKGRNYYHLIERYNKWRFENYTPLLLILLVLPDEKSKWLTINNTDSGLTIGGKAYWYFPTNKDKASIDINSKMISFSIKKQVSLDTFKRLFSFNFLKSI